MDESLVKKLSMAPAAPRTITPITAACSSTSFRSWNWCSASPRAIRRSTATSARGAFLHDLGKVDELSYDRGLAYTDEGQLIGHLIIAVEMLGPKIVEAEKLSGEKIPPKPSCGSSTSS